MSQPVHDPAAERYLLAALLASEGAREIAMAEIQADDLCIPDHRTIWAACCHLTASKNPVDGLGVVSYLRSVSAAQSASQTVLELDASTTFVSLDSVEKRVKRVKDLAAVRRVVDGARSLLLGAAGALDDPSVWLDAAEQAVTDAAQHRAEDGQLYTAREVMAECIRELVARADRKGKPDGYLSGFMELDEMLGGFAPGRFYVFAGRPGAGKSILSKEAVLGIVHSTGQPGLMVSLEMPKRELGDRMICSEAGVLYADWRKARLTSEQMSSVKRAAATHSELPLLFADKPGAAVEHVARWARRVKRRKGAVGVVMVDYLQLLGSTQRNDNREQHIAHVSRSLKQLALELHCPVIAVAQLNRMVEGRSDKRPMMSDIRESGAIEQDADAICLMYRDDYYNPESEDKGIVEVNVAKHRAGPTGVVRLSFQGQYVRICNLEERPFG